MYSLDTFVNTNKANCAFKVPANSNFSFSALDALETKFASKVQHDKVNDSAYPVIVYECNNSPVAWYDLELLRGFMPR